MTVPTTQNDPPASATNDAPRLVASALAPAPSATPAPTPDPHHQLQLTDFLDLETLQEIQDSFNGITSLKTTFRDAQGNLITVPTDTAHRHKSDAVLSQLLGTQNFDVQNIFSAPIIVEGQQLGSIAIELPREEQGLVANASAAIMAPVNVARHTLRGLAHTLGIADEQADSFITAAEDCCGPKKAAAVQFLYILASSIARLCYQDFQLRQRFEEVSTLHRLSTMLAGQREVQLILETAARQTTQALKARSASIRLLDNSGMLVPKAVFNLSPEFLSKTPVPLKKSKLHQQALTGQVVYVREMRTDKRTLYPDFVAKEGLVSTIIAGIVYRNQAIGVINIYTDHLRTFTRGEMDLLQSIANLLAGAITNAKLIESRQDAALIQRQLKLGADVQQRMLPQKMPQIPGFDIAARCDQSYDVGGDFYDFIRLDNNMGITIGDVVGKGIAASLLMAGVRASLRAFAQDIYDIDQIIVRVNRALSRDVRDGEFATLFYGVLDPATKRFTYCNAGHEPPLLLRDGRFQTLDAGGMILGVDSQQTYEKGVLDLRSGDMLLLTTDGLCEALDFRGQAFGRTRVKKALKEAAALPTANESLNHVLWAMRRFVGLSTRNDDTTLVLVRVK